MERTKKDLKYTARIIFKMLVGVLWLLLLPLFLIQDIIRDINNRRNERLKQTIQRDIRSQ